MDEDESPASEKRWKPSMRRWVSAWGAIVVALLLGVILAPGPGLWAVEGPARIPPDPAPARVSVVVVQASKPAGSPTAGTERSQSTITYRARLYRDVQHTGNWEFLVRKQCEVTGRVLNITETGYRVRTPVDFHRLDLRSFTVHKREFV